MIAFEPSEEQAALQALAHEFAAREIRPVAAHHDQTGEFPEEVLRKAHSLGLMNVHIPPRWGGPGLGVLDGCLVAEEIAWGCAGVSTTVEACSLALEPVIQGAGDALLERYVAPMVERFSLAAYCVTEPGGGSDVQALRTRAEHRGDRWVLNGQKAWITNAGLADWFFVLAITDPALRARGGMTAFIVERGWKGVSVGRKEWNMGHRSADTRSVSFEDVEVPEANVVGRVGQGWMLAMKAFDHTRPPVAAAAVGLARAAMEHTARYAEERVAFGVPIARHQAVAFLLADMDKDIDAARLLVWHAAWLTDQGHRNTREASMAKAFAADVAMRVATDAVQVFGAYGYNSEYPVEKLMRDAKLFSIYEGTSQIQRLVVARELSERNR